MYCLIDLVSMLKKISLKDNLCFYNNTQMNVFKLHRLMYIH